jgi:hypothetical protein
MQPAKPKSIDIVKEKVWEILISKVAAYGKKPILKFKWAIIVPRLDSKKERLINLSNRKEIIMDDETIDDTIADILGYCIIWQMLNDGLYEDAPILRIGEPDKRETPSYEAAVARYLDDFGKKAKRELKELTYYDMAGSIMNILTFVDNLVTEYVKNHMLDEFVDKELVNHNIMACIVESMLYLAHQPSFVSRDLE